MNIRREQTMGINQAPIEGLRARKKRETRQLISDIATQMFMERSFDDVRVSEIAARANVSEKTIYNYFVTKEALMFDRENVVAQRLRESLNANSKDSPVKRVLKLLQIEADEMRSMKAGIDDETTIRFFQRFREVINESPSLRTAYRDVTDRLAKVAAEAMAIRAGLNPDDPEPTIAAHALVGLWPIFYNSFDRHIRMTPDLETAIMRAHEDVQRAARLLEAGLWSFGVMMQIGPRKEEWAEAAGSAQKTGRQVFSALKQARNVWRKAHSER